jgi:hypothetical protein
MRELNYVEIVCNKLHSLLKLDDDLAELYALLLFSKGIATTLEDVHNAWAIWQNVSRPTHKSLIPFKDLTLEVQELDRKYMEAIHKVALEMQTIQQ